jgi:hypothetical protein
MKAITLDDPWQHVLKELNIANAADIIKDYVMTEMLRKISDFSQETAYFQKKYGQPLAELQAAYEQGEENFEQYDDLMQWEFAAQGLEYIRNLLLSTCKDDGTP